MMCKLQFLVISILLFNLQNIYAGEAPATTCRSHFAQNDVLNKFSTQEKIKLEAAAGAIAELLGKSEANQLRVKEDINNSVQNFVLKKYLTRKESVLFTAWFKERIQFYCDIKNEALRTAAAQRQEQKSHLEVQTENHVTYILAYTQILKKYNAQNLSDALINANSVHLEELKVKKKKKTNPQNENSESEFTTVDDILFILEMYEHLELTDEVFRVIVQYNHLAAVKYFIQNKLNVNSKSERGFTTFVLACMYNSNIEIIKTLYEAGGDLTTHYRKSPVLAFAAILNSSAEVMQFLVEVDPNSSKELANGSLLQNAVQQNSSAEVVQFLLFATRLSSKSKNSVLSNPSFLLEAAKNNHSAEVLQALLDAGASTRRMNSSSERPLHLAAEQNPNPNITKILIEADHGAELNSKDHDGDTPLHRAIPYNNPEVLKILIAAGANPMLRNRSKLTAADMIKNRIHSRYNFPYSADYPLKLQILLQAMEQWKKAHP